MEAKLVIVGGKANKRDVLLKLPTIIGRSREADLTVAHPMISRKHCELFESKGLLNLRDLGSLNGTLVGGERITEVALRPDEEFSVGPLTFRVQYEYVGEIADAPTREKDAAAQEAPDFQAFDEGEPTPEAEAAEQEAQPAGIAPPESELPDFEAWADDDDEAGLVETQPVPQPSEPTPPESTEEAAPPGESEVQREELIVEVAEEPVVEESPVVEEIAEEELPMVGESAEEEPVAVEKGEEPHVEASEETPPQEAEESPEAQPGKKKRRWWSRGKDKAAEEPQSEPEAPVEGFAQEEPVVSAPSNGEGSPEPPQPPEPAQSPELPQEEKTEQLPDFLAGAADEEEEAEEEEAAELSPEDEALNDFLKGLQ